MFKPEVGQFVIIMGRCHPEIRDKVVMVHEVFPDGVAVRDESKSAKMGVLTWVDFDNIRPAGAGVPTPKGKK